MIFFILTGLLLASLGPYSGHLIKKKTKTKTVVVMSQILNANFTASLDQTWFYSWWKSEKHFWQLGSVTDGNVKSIFVRLHKTILLPWSGCISYEIRMMKARFHLEYWLDEATYIWGSSILLTQSLPTIKILLGYDCLRIVHHKVCHTPWSSPRNGSHKAWE